MTLIFDLLTSILFRELHMTRETFVPIMLFLGLLVLELLACSGQTDRETDVGNAQCVVLEGGPHNNFPIFYRAHRLLILFFAMTDEFNPW